MLTIMKKSKSNMLKKKRGAQERYCERQFPVAIEYFHKGNLSEAERICCEIIKRCPEGASAMTLLGAIFLQVGNYDKALEVSIKAASINPSDQNNYIHMGLASSYLKDYSSSIKYYQTALEINRNNPLVFYNLGNAYKQIDKHQSAIEAYKNAIRLKPDYVKAYNNLGTSYLQLGNTTESIICFNNAIDLNSLDTVGYVNLGDAYMALGDFEKAEEYYKKFLELLPNYSAFVAGVKRIVQSLIGERKYKEAYLILEPIVDNKTCSECNIIELFGLICSELGRQEKAVEVVLSVISQENNLAEDQRSFHFELGRLYDEMKLYEKAFNHFRQANKSCGNLRFDPDKVSGLFEFLVEFYSGGNISSSNNISEIPVFIVGMPRSGTSLVEQILDCHPLIHGAGELEEIKNLVKDFPVLVESTLQYPEIEEILTVSDLDSIAKAYLDKLLAKSYDSKILRITDKMPSNFMFLGLIKRLFPQSRIIHCVRNPLDTCLSCYIQNFSDPPPFASDLSSLGIAYRQYEQLMSFWRDEINISMFEVQYEEMISHQEEVSRALVTYCGLEWDDNCLDFYKSKRIVHTASSQQVRKPIYSSSVNRWKNYEKDLKPLIDSLDNKV